MFKSAKDTVFVGRNLKFLPSCQSTNKLAVNWVAEGKELDGTVIITSEQTSGRGQRGNSWQSEPNQNLTFSLILKPSFLLASEQFNLNMAISIGIWDFLRKNLPIEPTVKWPNDLYCSDKKLGGILIENFIKNQRLENSVVGIGLNINQQLFDLPKATSLSILSGKQFELNSLLEDLLVCLERRYLELRSGKIERLKQKYLSILYRYQEKHQFADLREEFPIIFFGQILGIDKLGRLLVEKEGKIHSFGFKEIGFL
ncbi:MAG: BirA family biotin operon repressor/biotin-[acetyl-CoA-carboxylase] ligase [Flammeovirgaceae bacterium]